MRAMLLDAPRTRLRLAAIEVPEPGPGQVLIRIHACAVCRTDLHVVDGELDRPKLPLVPGHEIVGTVQALGSGASRFQVGARVGVPWLGWTCGVCAYCRSGRENLCDRARFTGYEINGGYAEYTVADERFCFPIPDRYSDAGGGAAAVRRADRISLATHAGEARASVCMASAPRPYHRPGRAIPGREIYAFTRPGDADARISPALWARSGPAAPTSRRPRTLDAAIIFAPVGALVPAALRAVGQGGIVVCAGIHMSDSRVSLRLLWGERVLRSVANLTRRDGEEFLALAPKVPVRTQSIRYALEQANAALDDLRGGHVQGAAVLEMT